MTAEGSMIKEYILQATTCDYEGVKSTLNQDMEVPTQEIEVRIDEEDVETSAFGIVNTISLLSFLQGRPAGISGIDFKENDFRCAVTGVYASWKSCMEHHWGDNLATDLSSVLLGTPRLLIYLMTKIFQGRLWRS